MLACWAQYIRKCCHCTKEKSCESLNVFPPRPAQKKTKQQKIPTKLNAKISPSNLNHLDF